MGAGLLNFVLTAAVFFPSVVSAQFEKHIEIRCVRDNLVKLIRELPKNTTILERGETGSLLIQGLSDPQRVVYLGKIPGTLEKSTDLLFQRIDGDFYQPIYRIPERALRDESNASVRGRSWILEPEQQVGRTCWGNAVTTCILSVDAEMRKSWKQDMPRALEDLRSKLLRKTIDAISPAAGGAVQQRAVDQILKDHKISSRVLDSSKPGDAPELWKHLSTGKPAMLEFAAEFQKFRKTTQRFENGAMETLMETSGRTARPAVRGSAGGHVVVATGTIDVPGKGRHVIVVDSATGSVELWPWSEVAKARPERAMRYRLVGVQERDPEVEMLTSISRTYGKRAADALARSSKDNTKLSGSDLIHWLKANEGKVHWAVINESTQEPVLVRVTGRSIEGEPGAFIEYFDGQGRKKGSDLTRPGPRDFMIPLRNFKFPN